MRAPCSSAASAPRPFPFPPPPIGRLAILQLWRDSFWPQLLLLFLREMRLTVIG